MNQCYMMVLMLLLCSEALANRPKGMERLSIGSDVRILDIPEDVELYLSPAKIREDKGFVYTTCDENFLENKSPEQRLRPEVRCTLHLVSPLAQRQECHFYYKAGDSKCVDEISFRQFGERKVLVLLAEVDEHHNKHARMNIVEWNDCTVRQITTPSIIRADQWKDITVESDEFHVTLTNNSMCHGLEVCKITFKSDGKQESKPTSVPNGYSTFNEIRAQPGSRDGGSFSYGVFKSDGKIHVKYTDANGIQKALVTVKNIPGDYMTSNDRDLYALCKPTGTLGEYGQQFWCMQYDWKTGEIINITFNGYGEERNISTEFRTVMFFNLDKGKFLFITVECEREGGACKTFHLSTVDSAGQVLKSVHIPMNLNCNGTFTFMNMRGSQSETDDEYCFNFLCSNNLMYKALAPRFISFDEKCIPKQWIE